LNASARGSWKPSEKSAAQAWQSFWPRGEPEKREANANVANYGKTRPRPSLPAILGNGKGSRERTQGGPDMPPRLFALLTDIAKPIAMPGTERGRAGSPETPPIIPAMVVQRTRRGQMTASRFARILTRGMARADKFTRVFADKLNIPTSFVFARVGSSCRNRRAFFPQGHRWGYRADVSRGNHDRLGHRRHAMPGDNLHAAHDKRLYGCVPVFRVANGK